MSHQHDKQIVRKTNSSRRRSQVYRAPAKANSRRVVQPRVENIGKQLALKVPDCSVHYIQALYDPFDQQAGVCIPADSFPLPSQKVKVFNRGVINLGTTGVGWIGLYPTAFNDLDGIVATTAASVGTPATALSAFTNLTNGKFTQLPYVLADATAGAVQARIVASGLRVRYAGTEDNRQGLYCACEDQDMLNIVGKSYNDIRALTQSDTRRPSGNGSWDQSVCYSGPVAPHMYEFTQLAYPVNADTGGFKASPLVICMQGGAGDAIEYEAVIHVEYIGSKIPGKTASHADNATYGKIIQTTKEMASLSPIQPEKKVSGFRRFLQFVGDSLPQIISTGVQVAGAVITRNPTLAMGALSSAASLISSSRQINQPRQPRLTYRQRQIMA